MVVIGAVLFAVTEQVKTATSSTEDLREYNLSQSIGTETLKKFELLYT